MSLFNNSINSDVFDITSYHAGHVSSDSMTRPNHATPLTNLDVVGEIPASVYEFSNLSGDTGTSIIITRAELRIDINSVPSGMSMFRLHLYTSSPTAIADNDAYDLPSGDRDKYVGYIEFDTPIDIGSTLHVQAENVNKQVQLATGSTTLYGILQTVTGYTPTASAVKKVTLYALEV